MLATFCVLSEDSYKLSFLTHPLIFSAESQRLDGELFANSVDGIELFPCKKLYLAGER